MARVSQTPFFFEVRLRFERPTGYGVFEPPLHDGELFKEKSTGSGTLNLHILEKLANFRITHF